MHHNGEVDVLTNYTLYSKTLLISIMESLTNGIMEQDEIIVLDLG